LADRPPLIETRELTRTFDGGAVTALNGVSVAIADGEFASIIGPSGCGKSSLLNLLGALDTPTSGDVRFSGQSLSQIHDLSQFRAQTIGFVFQSFHLLPTLTALENVQVPMLETRLNRAARRTRAVELLGAVGLDHRLHHLPAKLSGGERQRVAIARSLANNPKLLLADEPTGNLDTASSQVVLELLQQIHCERGMTIITVTHDPGVADAARRTLTMLDGRIVSDTVRPPERESEPRR
jgi:putative ABC transport system ATP-binding protein